MRLIIKSLIVMVQIQSIIATMVFVIVIIQVEEPLNLLYNEVTWVGRLLVSFWSFGEVNTDTHRFFCVQKIQTLLQELE
jgi:hypothetical protein